MRALALIVLMTLPAQAHDAPTGWSYPQECCSNRDCAPLDASRVREVTRGYLLLAAEAVLLR